MAYQAAVITVSDGASAGRRTDTSGPAVRAMLEEAGYQVVFQTIIPDEMDQIQTVLLQCCDEKQIPLVLTTGGTGFSPRDITPEATLAVIQREARGIPEAMRMASMQITPRGGLSIDPYCNYGKPGTRWEEVAWLRLSQHDLYPEKVDNR